MSAQQMLHASIETLSTAVQAFPHLYVPVESSLGGSPAEGKVNVTNALKSTSIWQLCWTTAFVND